jgi:hypothetical protein
MLGARPLGRLGLGALTRFLFLADLPLGFFLGTTGFGFGRSTSRRRLALRLLLQQSLLGHPIGIHLGFGGDLGAGRDRRPA